jgi:hypothetical protein
VPTPDVGQVEESLYSAKPQTFIYLNRVQNLEVAPERPCGEAIRRPGLDEGLQAVLAGVLAQYLDALLWGQVELSHNG